MKYKSNNNVVYSCKYHVVFCPKYRRSVLKNGVDKRLKEIIYETANDMECEILELEAAQSRWCEPKELILNRSKILSISCFSLSTIIINLRKRQEVKWEPRISSRQFAANYLVF